MIDLSPDQLAQAADLSWEWKVANSLRLCEQNWPARQCLRVWCHRCRVSLGSREAASAPVGSSGFDLAQVRQTVPFPLMSSWQYRGEKGGVSLFGRRPGWGGGRPGLFDSHQASWCWGLNIKTEKRKFNLSLPLALCYINEILISLATYTTLKLTNQRFFWHYTWYTGNTLLHTGRNFSHKYKLIIHYDIQTHLHSKLFVLPAVLSHKLCHKTEALTASTLW